MSRTRNMTGYAALALAALAAPTLGSAKATDLALNAKANADTALASGNYGPASELIANAGQVLTNRFARARRAAKSARPIRRRKAA